MILRLKNLKYLIKSLRPRHWTKNLIVFAAPFFAFQFTDFEPWFATIKTFILFSLSSSSIYLINDCIDINSDKLHPIKRFRPIASGNLSLKEAKIFAVFLAGFSVYISFQISILLSVLIQTYLLIQVLYCIRLKKEPLLDISCLALGFLIRAAAGGVSSNLYISPWFILTTGLLALFLAIEKRKAELKNSQDTGEFKREVLKRYSLPLLLRIESLVTTSAFVSYMLWASGPTLNGSSSSLMLLTVPFVLIGIFRYQLLSDPNELLIRKRINPNCTTENPEEILLKDKGIKIIIFCWFLVSVCVGLFS